VNKRIRLIFLAIISLKYINNYYFFNSIYLLTNFFLL